jgi:hypothetical protein
LIVSLVFYHCPTSTRVMSFVSLLMPVAELELSVLGFELSVLTLCYQDTTLC